jgi:Domain of unknown function (DUF1871)
MIKNQTFLHQVVKEAVDRWDPYGLLADGCPEDEFDPEVADVTQFVLKEQRRWVFSQKQRQKRLAKEIHAIFCTWFATDHFTLAECTVVAEEILQKLQNKSF